VSEIAVRRFSDKARREREGAAALCGRRRQVLAG
jgi:hypothetical protein